jgi:hypothetical protein
MKKVMQKDAARTEDVVPYNIIPLDSLTSTTNAIVNFLEVIVQSKVFFLLPICWIWRWLYTYELFQFR